MVLKARDVMSRHVIGIRENASLEEAAAKMLSEQISALIVNPEEQEQPYGIITSKDLVNAFADNRDLRKTKVGEVASTPLIVITPGVPVEYAARLMKRSDVRHLAVFNGREVIGILSNIDLLKALAKSKPKRIGVQAS